RRRRHRIRGARRRSGRRHQLVVDPVDRSGAGRGRRRCPRRRGGHPQPPAGAGGWMSGARLARPRRLLHPAAWWLWAAGLVVVALRTTNLWLLGLILAVAAFVVASRRSDAPWAMSFAGYLKLGVVVIVIRMLFPILFGNRIPGTTLFTLPSV